MALPKNGQRKRWSTRDNNGIGYSIYGHLQLREGKFDDALATAMSGIVLRTSCPLAHGLLGLILNFCGDPQSAVRSAREALRLEKVYPAWLIDILAAAYRDSGDVALSLPAAKESVRLNPQVNEARLILCSAYAMAGETDKARQVAEDIMVTNQNFRLSAYAEHLPYKNPEMSERVIGALREAGLPS